MLCLHSCYTLIAPRLHTTCTHRHNDEVRAELACDGEQHMLEGSQVVRIPYAASLPRNVDRVAATMA